MTLKQALPLFLYKNVTKLLQPFAKSFLGGRVKRGKEDLGRIGERLGIASKPRLEGKLFWLHAASVGEFMSLMPIIQHLQAQNVPMLVTTGTVTSATVAAQRLPSSAVHQFIPLDIPAYVARFLDYWTPDLAIFTESELWPNLICYAAQNSVPMVIINGRLSARSFSRWQKMPSFIKALLSKMDFCLAQTQEDADRFRALGARHVQNAGNLKFDCAPLPVHEKSLNDFLSATDGRKIWLAASTHEGEECIVVEAHTKIKQNYPNVLSVIVPRHPERGAALADVIRLGGLSVCIRSKGEIPSADTDVYIADTIGELGLFYRACRAALIGCSLFAPGGGHNPIEAAQLGTVILFGAHIRNFTSVYTALEGDGCLKVSTANDIADALDRIFGDETYYIKTGGVLQKTVEQLGGAAETLMSALQPYIDRPSA